MLANAGIFGGAATVGSAEETFWVAALRDQITEDSGSTHTFTIAGQTGVPRAGLFLRNYGAVNATLIDVGALNVGAFAYDGTSVAQWASSNNKHNSAPGSNNGCDFTTSYCGGLGRYNSGWQGHKQLSISSRNAGNIVCNVTSNEGFTATPFATTLLLGGTSFRCAAGSAAIPTSANGVTTVTCTDNIGDFNPDFLLVSSPMKATAASVPNQCIGLASINGAAYIQACAHHQFTTDSSNYLSYAIIRNDVGLAALTTGGSALDGLWTLAPRGTNNGFTLTKNAGGAAYAAGNFGWLAFKGINAKVLQFAMPSTATDNVDVDTSAAFIGKTAILITTMLPTVNTISQAVTPDGYSFGVSIITPTAQFCTALPFLKVRDNVHNAQSISTAAALKLPLFDYSADGYAATYDSFPSNGVLRLDFGTVNASSTARQAIIALLG